MNLAQNGRRGPRLRSPWCYVSHGQAAMDQVGWGARTEGIVADPSAGRAHNSERGRDPGSPGGNGHSVVANSRVVIRASGADCFIRIERTGDLGDEWCCERHQE